VYGHIFAVKFRLKYAPATFGDKFTEMPRLEWKETITMLEPGKAQWWEYIGDQFQRNPDSPTFITWTTRYKGAYYAARRTLYGADEPSCLYDKMGAPLPATALPQLNGKKEQADAVRSYLSKNGGIMTVTVIDTPGINKPTDGVTVKERILTFDCGLHGLSPRVSAIQHLKVDGSVPEANWFRDCTLSGISRPFATPTTWTKVAPPADVSVLKPFTGGAHEGSYL
jgi:hypothetical protein